MINTSAAYKTAVVADARRCRLRVAVDITDPDIVYGAVTSSGETIYSQPAQLHDRVVTLFPPSATLSLDRWMLDGGFEIADANTGEVGFESSGLFDETGAGNLFVQLNFSGVTILQACSVYFPDNDHDGYPVDFTVDVMSGGSVEYTETFTGNTAHVVALEGFTVNSPDAIRVTVTQWSLPYRRMRVAEIVAGVYEEWTGADLESFMATQQCDPTGLSLPYGTCTLSMDNTDRRFDPRDKDSIFQSIEERQGIAAYIGVDTPATEWVPIGVYYQYAQGWKTGNARMTMQWQLVDIVGLLQGRAFVVPSPLPTTLSGWAAALVAQLGTAFSGRYSVPTDAPAYLGSADDVADKTCGQIMMWLAQATQTVCYADQETGYLCFAALGSAGNTYTLGNLTDYPVSQANTDVARIDFQIGSGSPYVVQGSEPAAPTTVSIQNPFIHSTATADLTAAQIFAGYNDAIDTVGRGDPSTELCDLASVEFAVGDTENAYVVYQTYQFQSGVLQGCQTRLVVI